MEEVTDFMEDDKIWPDTVWPLKKEEKQIPVIDIQFKLTSTERKG